MIGLSVGFTGTQKGVTDKQWHSLQAVFQTLRLLGYAWLHEGDCVGADAEANKLWRQCTGKIHQHPPIKTKLRAYSLFDHTELPKDYLVRNKDIVNAADILVACPKGPEELRSGTWSTVRYARNKEIRRLIVMPSGIVVRESV